MKKKKSLVDFSSTIPTLIFSLFPTTSKTKHNFPMIIYKFHDTFFFFALSSVTVTRFFPIFPGFACPTAKFKRFYRKLPTHNSASSPHLLLTSPTVALFPPFTPHFLPPIHVNKGNSSALKSLSLIGDKFD